MPPTQSVLLVLRGELDLHGREIEELQSLVEEMDDGPAKSALTKTMLDVKKGMNRMVSCLEKFEAPTYDGIDDSSLPEKKKKGKE